MGHSIVFLANILPYFPSKRNPLTVGLRSWVHLVGEIAFIAGEIHTFEIHGAARAR